MEGIPLCDLMVCISTRQNTTNLVPFVQFDAKRMLLFETDGARAGGWSDGLKRTVQHRKGESACTIKPLGLGDDVPTMVRNIAAEITTEDKIWWNIGGGQKLQSISCFEIFRERTNRGRNDVICYSEPQTRQSKLITSHGDLLRSTPIATCADLSMQDVLMTFGKEGKDGKLLWRRTGREQGVLTADVLFSSLDDRNFIHQFGHRQAMFQYELDKDDGKAPAVCPYPPSFEKFADYFEAVVQFRMAYLVAEAPTMHRVNEVWANVHVYPDNSGQEEAEFDLVLATDFGTIIPLDAKTLEFSKKDEEARLLNLGKATGLYSELVPVFPYFPEDLAPKSVLYAKKWRKLLLQPFERGKDKRKMLIYTDPDLDCLLLERRKNRIRILNPTQIQQGKKTSWEKVETLNNCLEFLNISSSVKKSISV